VVCVVGREGGREGKGGEGREVWLDSDIQREKRVRHEGFKKNLAQWRVVGCVWVGGGRMRGRARGGPVCCACGVAPS
jgi:hypothetical protein